jgi:transcriptional regulator with XRE-family HTH domain
MSITPEQVTAARRLLRWTQIQLAFEASVSEGTVAHFETGARQPSDGIVLAIRKALEDAGVAFTNRGKPGARLRKGRE